MSNENINESGFDYTDFLQKKCNYEIAIAEEATRCIMGKLYTMAFNDGFNEGYIKGFLRAKEAYNKGANNEQ